MLNMLLVFSVMKTAPTLLGVFLCVAVSAISQDTVPQAKGAIFGVVVDENNQPAKGIGIAVAGPGKSPPRRLPGVKTDQSGHYRIGKLLGWGTYTVYAEDWDAGYSTFVNSESHEVTISSGRPEAELNFRLPPRAGFLDFHLTNRKTGKEISHLVVSVRPARGEYGVRANSGPASQPVLVAPDEDLLIHVTSPGFREWNRSAGKGLPIRVKSGNHLKLDVQLEPAS